MSTPLPGQRPNRRIASDDVFVKALCDNPAGRAPSKERARPGQPGPLTGAGLSWPAQRIAPAARETLSLGALPKTPLS